MLTFGDCSLDIDRRELRRGAELVRVEPQVFDVLVYLVRNRHHVVSRDDLLASVWGGRIVSESTLASRINAARSAIGDTGDQQSLIRTVARKGFRFVAEVRELDRSDDDEALRRPAPRDELTAPARGPERRQLTILACDMTGSVALTGHLDPEDLSEVTAACHKRIRAVVEDNGGFIAKCAADSVVAYFGYPQAHEDDAERAVRSALAVLRSVSDLRFPTLARGLAPRAGIATGLVVVGADEGADAQPTAVGETPHLAAHLLNLARPGTIVIAASTRRLVGNLFEFGEVGQVDLPPSDEPIEFSRVLRESAIPSRFDALRSTKTQLIGREEELDLLSRRWAGAKAGEGRVVLIWGEPGIGKSRLVAAVVSAVQPEGCPCLSFYCAPHRGQTALHPVMMEIERAAGFDRGDSDERKLDKLEALFAASSRDVKHDAALFAELLSIPIGDRYPPLSLSPQLRKEHLLERYVARLVAVAARRPVLVIVEDAHWIDPTTRELIDIVIERMRSLPILLIMTYRPEFVPPWLGQSHVTTLTLNRLGRRESAAMIKRVAGERDLPSVILEQVVTHTDGVPLFIEEMTKSVLESGVLRKGDDGYVLAEQLPAPAIPATLQASLVARLDRLPSARPVAQTGAALGREFTYAAVKAVTKLSDGELGPLLDQLVASELVHRRGAAPDALYTFKHALVQDAAHDTLLKNQRAQLHGRIADVLEREFPETPKRNPDVMATHCTEAGYWGRAIDYRLKAARMALDRSAGIEAQAQVENGVGLLPKITDGAVREQFQGRLLVALGDALVMTRGFASPEVADALSRARELLDEAAYPAESLHAICGLFNYHLMRSESPKGLKLANSFSRGRADRAATTVAEFLLGAAHLHMGNFSDARLHLENAFSLYDEEACRSVAFVAGYHVRSFTLIWLGLLRVYIGSFNSAGETIRAAVEDARARSHPFTLVSALLACARFLQHVRDLQGAIEATEEAFNIAVEQRSPYHVSRSRVLRAVNVIESNQPEQGIALMKDALEAHRATGANYQSSYNLSYLAVAHAKAGRRDRAIELATQAVIEVERTGERWWEAEAQRLRGEILLTAGAARLAEAEACFQRAIESARRQKARLWELHAAQSLAKLWQAWDRGRDARNLLAPVYQAFADGLDLPALVDAKRLLSELSSE